MSRIIADKIAAAQARYRVLAVGEGIGRAAVLFCAWLVVTALVDWRVNLPRPVRVVLVLLNAALAVAVLIRDGVLPAARGLDEESVALLVERRERQFATRLIAAVQLARPGAIRPGESAAAVETMIRQTEDFAEPLDFRTAISAEQVKRAALAAAAVLVIAAGLFIAGGSHSAPLTLRALGASTPWPSRTRITSTSGPLLVPIGDAVTIRARAVGYRPDAAVARISFADNRRQNVTLSRISDDEYAGTLENVTESFRYRVEVYDATSEPFDVRAEPRPAVEALTCTQILPAYTQLPEIRRDPADLLILAGSRMKLHITTNKPLTQPGAGGSRIVFTVQQGSNLPPVTPLTLTPIPGDGRSWRAEFEPAANVTGFSIHLVDPLGIESKDEPVYPIRLITDRPPVVRVTRPAARQILVTANAECALEFTASDDIGLAGLSLKYRVGDEPEVAIPLPLPSGQKEFRGGHAWRLASVTPPAQHPTLEDCVVEFYIEARDNNPTGKGVAESEHFQLRVVSKADKQAELISRMADSFGAMQELTDKQNKSAMELRALAQPAATQPGEKP